MRIAIVVLMLLGAQFNLSGLVPLKTGQAQPPWWVGGRLIWPFAQESHTLLLPSSALNTLTPILAIGSALCFVLAALAFVQRIVPTGWFPALVVIAAALSTVLQAVWFSGWALPPLLLNAALLWAIFGQHLSVSNLR